MILKSFQILNFKSIVDSGEIQLPEKGSRVLVLAGQNEAGKSSILEGLSYFANGPSSNFARLQRRADGSLAQVSCRFELSDSDLDNISSEYPGQNKLMDHFRKVRELTLVRWQNEKGNHIFGYFSDFSDLLKTLFVPVLADEAVGKDGQDLDQFKSYLKGPVFRKSMLYDEEFNNLLPGEVTIATIPTTPSVLDFQSVFKIDFASVVAEDERGILAAENRLSKTATDDLNRYWSQKLSVGGGRYSFKVKITKNEADLSQSKVMFMVMTHDDDPSPSYMEQRSKGFRWFSAFNLRLRALGLNSAPVEDLVLLIDEPGTGLHERAQVDLKNVLEELADKGAQIIYSTHNPLMIGTQGQELARLRLVVQTSKLGTKAYTVAQYASTKDSGAKETLSPIVTAMGLQSIESIALRSLNIITEGITDHYYWKGFAGIYGVTGINFIPAVGASNVINLASILFGWNAKFKVVLDDDAAGRGAASELKSKLFGGDQTAYDAAVYKVKGAAGVEDVFEKADFAKFILKSKPKSVPNSKLAEGKKELLARIFSSDVDSKVITKADLGQETSDIVAKALAWMKS